ncbi:MAG: TrmH family RNA methyltransferase [Burkholderiales bacterium]
MKHIISRNNALFRSLSKLARSSRARRKTGKALLDGPHLVSAYCSVFGVPETVVVSASGMKHHEIRKLLRQIHKLDPYELPDTLFNEISPVPSPTGILAVIKAPVPVRQPEKIRFCVLLENIQDAGNLGSILRSAAAAGADCAFLSKNCVFAWSPKTLRAAMGAHFQLPIFEDADLQAVAKSFKGKIITTDPDAKKSLYQTDCRGPVAFVIGNEGVGVSPPLQNFAHECIKIPMPGKTESLNAAAAAAICLFEKIRQEQWRG